jgi:outer membrane protein OmpA-like peptidoglycan-associated protein
LGVPLNTPYDEQCIVVSADYRNGYYSSKGKDTFGDHDIYKVTFMDVDEPMIMAVDYSPTSLFSAGVKKVEVEGNTDYALLTGSVKDFNDKSPLDAKIVIKNRRDNSIVKEITNDPSTGKFLVALPLDNSYEVTVRATGYFYFSENYIGFGRDDKEVYNLDAKIKKIIAEQTLILKKVFFKKASAEMVGTSYDELDKLVQVLRENPGIEIEISGHTDNIGNKARLIRLSRQRMEAVRTYLVNRGINKNRLEGQGYGGMHPIADNADPAKRALNRRVEFKVLKVK